MKKALNHYVSQLSVAHNAMATIKWPEIEPYFDPKVLSKVLWIPSESWNRTATINLNHGVGGFDGNDVLWGYNGNCDTPYAIVPVPQHWGDAQVDELAAKVCEKLGKTSGIRVLKADNRLRDIIATICEMAGKEWADEFIGDVDALDLTSSEEKENMMCASNIKAVVKAAKVDKATGHKYMTEKEWERLSAKLHTYPEGHHWTGMMGVREQEQYLLHKDKYGSMIVNYLGGQAGAAVRVVDVYEEKWVDRKGIETTHHVIIIGSVKDAVKRAKLAWEQKQEEEAQLVADTFVRGVLVKRHNAEVVAKSREEVIAAVNGFGLGWNDACDAMLNRFIDQPITGRVFLGAPGSGSDMPLILRK